MSRLNIQQTPLKGLSIIERKKLSDSRGFLSRLFCHKELATAGWQDPVAQINQTATVCRGTIRGMHYQQAPHSEKKLIHCLKGAIWDVAVDIRQESPTFLQWFGIQLSIDNCLGLLIPQGFAHGFQSLTDNVELLYCHSKSHHAKSERGLHPQDPKLAIDWPVSITQLSDRDKSHPFLQSDFRGILI
jgi:dTDP-4-dehydrorhamnose 3,5-epimerase